MEVVKEKRKKSLIFKAWERCRSLGAGVGRNGRRKTSPKASSNSLSGKNVEMAPCGCFSVYVGPQRQRFVVKTEYVNHPLFKALLDEAELEYGFHGDGPIWLPCNVDLFYKVLAEMDEGEDAIAGDLSLTKGYASSALCSPLRLWGNLNSGHSDYMVLSSRMLKMNQSK